MKQTDEIKQIKEAYEAKLTELMKQMYTEIGSKASFDMKIENTCYKQIGGDIIPDIKIKLTLII